MIKDVGYNMIHRFGSKGHVVLLRETGGEYDPETMTKVSTKVDIPLLTFVGKLPLAEQNQNNTHWSRSAKVLAAVDSDFDGQIVETDRIKINNIMYDITNYTPSFINNELVYVELICNG